MHLDVPTLMAAGALVAALSGTLLLVVRHQYRDTGAVLWWAAADLILAVGMLVLAVDGADRRLVASPLMFLALNPALILIGAWRFDGRPAPFLLAGFGAGLPLMLAALGVFSIGTPQGSGALHVVQAAVGVVFYLAAAGSLALHRAEALRARLPLAILCTLHAIALSLTATDRFAGPPGSMARWGDLYGLIHLEALVFLVGSTLFLVAAMRERSEHRHRHAAHTDDLTRLLNRRGFVGLAGRMLERARVDGTCCTAIVFDLDSFKAMNDAHGHAFGDRALRLFADTANAVLRPQDLIGRIGGEEFAVLLPGSDVEAGRVIGDRVREAYAEASRGLGRGAIVCTLSGGVAALEDGESLDALLGRADRALYRAKQAGRDRIECEPSRPPSLRVVRSA
jgi:diguanylate cyclase (GGDEF)-like protein